MIWEFVIPLTGPLPSPNSRMNRQAWWRKKAELRGLAKVVSASERNRQSIPSAVGPRHLTLDIIRTRGRARDIDNAYASLKAPLDGLVDAGLLLDDGEEGLAMLQVKQSLGKSWGLRVVLRDTDGPDEK